MEATQTRGSNSATAAVVVVVVVFVRHIFFFFFPVDRRILDRSGEKIKSA